MRLRHLTLAACLSSLCLAALPVVAEEAPVLDPAAEMARAKGLKDEASTLRKAAEARFSEEEIACYQRFLVNRCIDQARARRVADVRKAREMDVEAGRIELAEKNRRYAERQAESVELAPQKAVERSEQEARARAGNESRLRQLSDKETSRVQREQEGKARAAQEVAERKRKDASDASRRAAEARAAGVRAEQAREGKADYEERARKAAEKKAEKAEKARQAEQDKSSGKAAGKPAGEAGLLPGK